MRERSMDALQQRQKQRRWQPPPPRLSRGRALLLCVLLHAALQQAAAVKRTMPMIGMDEDGDELVNDATPATTPPRNALRSMISAFLSGDSHAAAAPAPAASLTPVDREFARQAVFQDADRLMDDLNGGDALNQTEKLARTPNIIGSGGGTGLMSYHGGRIVSTPLQVYFIMCASYPGTHAHLADTAPLII
jgi:hypothetical protein